MTQKERRDWPAEDTVLAGTDRRYKIAGDGSFRKEPGEGQELPKRPVCLNGIDTYTGKKCYCRDCRDDRRRELAGPTPEQLEAEGREIVNRLMGAQIGKTGFVEEG